MTPDPLNPPDEFQTGHVHCKITGLTPSKTYTKKSAAARAKWSRPGSTVLVAVSARSEQGVAPIDSMLGALD